MNNKTLYDLDMDALFECFMSNSLNVNKKAENGKYLFAPGILNLIIRPECNQQCEYCYIYKYGDQLYPKEKRVDSATLLKNLKLLLEYLDTIHCYFRRIELYAGDLFYDDLFFDIVDILYDYYIGLKKRDIINFNKEFIDIIVPTNFSFCNHPDKIEKFSQYFEKFRSHGLRILLSYSGDGPYATDIREKKELTDEFYHTVFSLIKKYNFGCHPMISVESIKSLKKNYDWWVEQHKKYNLFTFQPMLLEVRNGNWTDEAIADYMDALTYMFNKRLAMCDNDPWKLANHFFIAESKIVEYNNTKTNESDHILRPPIDYDPVNLTILQEDGNHRGCSIVDCSIYLAQLNVVPCHRLTYPQFEGGRFVLNEEKTKIIGMEAAPGFNGFFITKGENTSLAPGCATCGFRNVCLKGCCGAQYEFWADPLLPIPNVCKMFKEKYSLLFELYEKHGLIDLYLNKQLLEGPSDLSIQKMEALRNEVKKYRQEKEEVLIDG